MISKLDLEFGLKVVATVGAGILRNQYKGFAPKNCKSGTHSVSGLNTVCFYGNKSGVYGLLSRTPKDGYEFLGYVKIYNGNDPIKGSFTEIRDPGRPFELIAENASLFVNCADYLLKKLNLANANYNLAREKYINKIIEFSQNSITNLQPVEKTFVNTQEYDLNKKLVA